MTRLSRWLPGAKAGRDVPHQNLLQRSRLGAGPRRTTLIQNPRGPRLRCNGLFGVNSRIATKVLRVSFPKILPSIHQFRSEPISLERHLT